MNDWQLNENSTGFNSEYFYIQKDDELPSPSFSFSGFNFIEEYQPPKQTESVPKTQTQTKDPEYSEWKQIPSSKCNMGIEYQSKRLVRYKLNYQLWFYYQVRNTSSVPIKFDFHLTYNGKKEFSQGHTLGPGGSEEFMHKMSADYINGIAVSNVVNTNTGKGICETENSNGSTTNNTSSSSSMIELLNNWNTLCQKADNSQNPAVLAAKQRSCLNQAKNFEDNAANRNMIASKIKDLENAFASDKNFQNQQDDQKAAAQKLADDKQAAAQKAAEDKAAAEQKALEEKQAQFEKYMTDGDNYLSSENYNSAINSYSNAVNSATNTSESSRAQNALAAAQKAKADADRKIRVAEKQAVEKSQNEATTAAVTGFAGAMALVKDNYSNGKFAAKFQVGLGYGSMPLIVNSTKQVKSTIKSNNQILFHMGFNLTLFNKKGINFELKPSLGIGLSSFQKGTDGGSEEYGGTGILWLAPKAKSTFKVFAEGGYFFKNGTYNYDEDVAIGPTSATDNVEKGEFKYKLLRYGGGFKISFVNDDNLESYIKPGIFLETPSFFSKTTKPTMVFNLQAYILSNALIDFSYSKNYFIPGNLDYAGNLKKENKDYFSIKIIRQGKLK